MYGTQRYSIYALDVASTAEMRAQDAFITNPLFIYDPMPWDLHQKCNTSNSETKTSIKVFARYEEMDSQIPRQMV